MTFNKNTFSLLEKELSYKLQGIFINVSKKHGYLYKEEVYQKILVEEFRNNNIKYLQKPKIKIYNIEKDCYLGNYYPDFLIDNKVIIEIKAQKQLFDSHINQLIRYLNVSKYELGYVVNFGSPKAQIIRKIYTNDRKPFFTNDSRMAHEWFSNILVSH